MAASWIVGCLKCQRAANIVLSHINTFTYTVLLIAGEESVNYVNEAIDEWQSRTCVTFHEKTDSDEDYIQFVYEQG